jgi:hypothetical protein
MCASQLNALLSGRLRVGETSPDELNMRTHRHLNCLVAVLAVAASQTTHAQPTVGEPTPAEWFFSEDHHTGALYLHLGPKSKYALQAREHMGIFLFDVGE